MPQRLNNGKVLIVALALVLVYAGFLIISFSRSDSFSAQSLRAGVATTSNNTFGGTTERRLDKSYITYGPNERLLPSQDSAYVMMALGISASTRQCQAAIESLVRYGGWTGHIYLLTDREECFDRDEIVRNAEMDGDYLHIQKVEGDYGSGGFDVLHPYSVGSRRKRKEALAMKTRLFDYIPEQNIQTIAYVDCDIIFAEKNCAYEFIAGGPPQFAQLGQGQQGNQLSWQQHRIKFSWLLRDEQGALQDIHCGTFLAHRQHSRELMEVWRREIFENVEAEGDNDAYMAVYRRIEQEIRARSKVSADRHSSGSGEIGTSSSDNHNASDGGSISSSGSDSGSSPVRSSSHLFPSGNSSGSSSGARSLISVGEGGPAGHHSVAGQLHNLFEPGLVVKADEHGQMTPVDLEANRLFERRYEKFIDSQKQLQPICMNHISKARCLAGGREAMQRWVNQLSLRTYGRSYYYCVHPALNPLMYGWFPISYIPFCPKLDSLL